MAAAANARRPEPTSMSESVGDNVRAERKKAGLSVRELARRLGVSAKALRLYDELDTLINAFGFQNSVFITIDLSSDKVPHIEPKMFIPVETFPYSLYSI